MFKKIISGALAGITAISITIFPSFSEGSVEKKAIYYLPGYGNILKYFNLQPI